MRLSGYFRDIQVKYSRIYAQVLAESDLSLPQFALLGELQASGLLPMTQASCQLHISKPAVTHLVDRLEKKKMVRRINHPEDRRVDLLQITPFGKEVVRKTQAKVLRYLLETIDQFNVQDQKIILTFYNALSEVLNRALANQKHECHEKK